MLIIIQVPVLLYFHWNIKERADKLYIVPWYSILNSNRKKILSIYKTGIFMRERVERVVASPKYEK